MCANQKVPAENERLPEKQKKTATVATRGIQAGRFALKSGWFFCFFTTCEQSTKSKHFFLYFGQQKLLENLELADILCSTVSMHNLFLNN